MDYSKIITIEPGKRSGKPCIRGMRITVSDVLEYLASGMTEEEILNDFPELTREVYRDPLDGPRAFRDVPGTGTLGTPSEQRPHPAGSRYVNPDLPQEHPCGPVYSDEV